MGPKNSYKCDLTNLLVPLVMLSLNHQNHKQWPRWGMRVKKRVPAKVMWYFPLIPCLKRLFLNKMNAKLMRWHKEERKLDNMLRHPADGSQWRKVDRTFLT